MIKILDICPIPPVTCFLPVNHRSNVEFTNFIHGTMEVFPSTYESPRPEIKPQDLTLLLRDHWIKADIDGTAWQLTAKRGLVFDVASVPNFLSIGRLSKFGQHIEVPALYHDIAFDQQLFGFEVANELFQALIRYVGLTTAVTEKLYCAGVKSPVGKRIYSKGDPINSHMVGYYELTRL